MSKVNILDRIKDYANSWRSYSSNEQKRPRILVLVSKYLNEWDRRAVSAMRAYFLESNIQDEQAPDFTVIGVSQEREALLLDLAPIDLHLYSGVVTMGAVTSVVTKAFLTENNLAELPLFACGVKDPVQLGLAKTFDSVGSHTGIVTGRGHSYEKQVESFMALRPEVRRVNLVSYSDLFSEKLIIPDVMRVSSAFQRLGVDVRLHQLSYDSEVARVQIDKITEWGDVVCTFRDILMKNDMLQLIKACEKKKITVFSSELASVILGAAAGFGDTGACYGEKVACLLDEHFYRGRSLVAMPVALVKERSELKVNMAMMEQQGVNLDRRSYLLMSNVEPMFKD